jgi:hypothetical protein
MTDTYFIIEHPTRGTLRYWADGAPHFSTRGLRSDAEYAKQYRTLPSALRDHDKLIHNGSKSLKQCQVRRAPDFKYYCRECGSWIDTKFGHEFGHIAGCPMRGEE